MKKRLFARLLAAALTLTLAACGEKTNADTPLPDEPPWPSAWNSPAPCPRKTTTANGNSRKAIRC